jgi:signal transduction histidine kinase
MQNAKQLLDQLLADARSGALIPIRLPDQIAAIQTALLAAEQQHSDALAQAQQEKAVTGDAQEAISEYAEFIKTAVHELRTPMTSIRGYLSDMQKELLAVIRSNTRRMENLLSDISITNKLRAGILPVHKKMDMFKNVAQMAEKKMQPLAEDLDRQLEFNIPQGLPLLNTDGEHLALVLSKLIENGLRYSAQGDGKVTVSASREDSTLVVAISDNGIGMTDTDLANLGKLYYRGDHDAIREHKGSGLGMVIAYGLMNVLDGSIDVQSEPEKGTTFTVRLHGIS